MNWLLKLLFSAIGDALIAVIDSIKLYLDNVFAKMYTISEGLGLSDIRKYTVAIGLGLVGVFAVKQGIDVYVLHTEGDSDADPLELITRIAKATATILCGGWFINYLVERAGIFASEVMEAVAVKDTSDTITKIASDSIGLILAEAAMVSFVFLIFLVIVIISLIMLIFKAAKRAAELMLFSIMLPIMAVDLLTTSKERWNAFRTELIICIFGYVVQLLCYGIFMVIFAQLANGLNIEILIAALAWLMLVLSAPKWIQKFSYSSGVGSAAKGGMRSVTNILPSIIKRR